MIVKAESLKTRYQNVRQINTVLLSLETIKLYSKLEKVKIDHTKTYYYMPKFEQRTREWTCCTK